MARPGIVVPPDGPLPPALERKYLILKEDLHRLGSVLVAYSGGVDSVLLARVAHEELKDLAAALTAVSPSFPAEERAAAAACAREIGILHVEVESREFDNPEYLRNAPDRCFHCKQELFNIIKAKAKEMDLRWVVYGAITDDLGDDRPGMRAALDAGARAPLLEAGLGKQEVRALSRFLGLPTWDKPAAACLASRVPHGTPIRIDILGRVEKLEAFLHRAGFRLCRVRVEQESARIEVDPSRVGDLLREPLRGQLAEAAREAGFRRVAVDLEGYRPPTGAGGSIEPKR